MRKACLSCNKTRRFRSETARVGLAAQLHGDDVGGGPTSRNHSGLVGHRLSDRLGGRLLLPGAHHLVGDARGRGRPELPDPGAHAAGEASDTHLEGARGAVTHLRTCVTRYTCV